MTTITTRARQGQPTSINRRRVRRDPWSVAAAAMGLVSAVIILTIAICLS